MTSLTLDGVSVTRGKRLVLDAVSAAFAPGKLTVVIGPNGAGKSTLLDVAAGLLAPIRGHTTLDGVALARVPQRDLARRRAYLPQSPRVDWAISVERVVALGLTPHLPAFGGLPTAWQPAIDAALDRFDLTPLRERPATQLSGGELARVMLARAIVGAPELIIVDEPTAGLDPRHALDAARHLRTLAEEGRTVIVALHDLDLAARVADEMLAVKAGRVVAHGPIGEVLTETVLSGLYDVGVRVRRDDEGTIVRFTG